MNWIKKNPAQFGLAVVSVAMLASAYLLFSNYSGFAETFEESQRTPTPNTEIPAVDLAVVEAATQTVASPAVWTSGKGRLLASKLYVSKEGQLQRPTGAMFHPPVPNEWLLKHELDLLNPSILNEDPDRDGFNTRLEWDGMDAVTHLSESAPYGPVTTADGKTLPDDATNPMDAASHPPYHTRLALAKVVNIPFRLRFMSYDVNPRKPEDITVGINTVDRGGRTYFLPVKSATPTESDIPNTKFRVEKFEKKEVPGADGTKTDASELTVLNKESGQLLILPLNRVVDSPESYVVIRYLWAPFGGQPVPDMNKQKGQTFTIPPETDKVYKVIDIRQAEVDIQLPSGEKRTLRQAK